MTLKYIKKNKYEEQYFLANPEFIIAIIQSRMVFKIYINSNFCYFYRRGKNVNPK